MDLVFMSRSRSIFLPLAILCVLLVGATQTLAADPFKEVDGRLVIEAENYHSKSNIGVRDWYIFPRSSSPQPDPDGPHTTGAVNGKYVEALPDTRVTHDDPLVINSNFFHTGSGAPRMNYKVVISSPGRYYIRARALSTGSEDNGVHFGYDNNWPTSGTAAQWCIDWRKWGWSGNRRTETNHCGVYNALYLDLPAGEHTIMVGMREDGFELDRFILTKDSKYFPSDAGPPESPRTTGVVDDDSSSDNDDQSAGSKNTTLTEGIEYYTDRAYRLTNVPSFYDGMNAIIIPNDERNRTDSSGYLTFTMPYDGTVYVGYDSRAISEPNWMDDFFYTGDVLQTSLSTQPSLRIYGKFYDKGDKVDFGANKAPGFVGGTVSNYIVFFDSDSNATGSCSLDGKFDQVKMNVGTSYYNDRNYTITGNVPDWMVGRTLIQTPNDDRNNRSSSGYLTFTMPVSWWVYVLFDSRSASVPDWLNSWERYTKYDDIETSLSSQPSLKMYRKMFDAGDCVNLGGNYGPGSSSEYRSNYVVVYGK